MKWVYFLFVTLVLLVPPGASEAGDFWGKFAYLADESVCIDNEGVELCLIRGVLPTSASRELVIRVRVKNKTREAVIIGFDDVSLATDLPESRVVRRTEKDVLFLCKRRLVFPAAYTRQINRCLLPDTFTLASGESKEGLMRFAVLLKGEITQEKPVVRGEHLGRIVEEIIPFSIRVGFRGQQAAQCTLALTDIGGVVPRYWIRHVYTRPEALRRVKRVFGSADAKLFEFEDGGVLLIVIKENRMFCDGSRQGSRITFSADIPHPRSGRKRCGLKRLGIDPHVTISSTEVGGKERITLSGFDISLEREAGAPLGTSD